MADIYMLTLKDKFAASSKFISENSSGFVNIYALIAAHFDTIVLGSLSFFICDKGNSLFKISWILAF